MATQSFDAAARIGGLIQIIPNAMLDQTGLADPDGVNTFWPTPHDAKIDTIAFLRTIFSRLGLDDIAVSKDGAFTAAQLADIQGNGVPYVTVVRGNDVPLRYIDQLISTHAQGDPALVDDENVVPPNGVAAIFGELSQVSIDIVISDTNSTRADQLFIVLKIAMTAGIKEFLDVGYIDVKRVSAGDGVKIEVNGPTGPFLVHNRTLSYQMVHPTYIASVDHVITLLQQSLNTNPASPDASIVTNL